eukprot:10054163-Alexandrium_andersonii.AAC.1
MHPWYLTQMQMNRLEAVYHRMLRVITRTPSTYASKVLGVGAIITHRQLREKLGVSSLEDTLRFRRLWLLRGVLTRDMGDP